MGSSNSDENNIFSKVNSKKQRNEIFSNAIKEQVVFICKGNKESLYYFKPKDLINDGSLQGEIKPIEGEIVFGETVVNFGANNEKYFYNTYLDLQKAKHVLLSTEQLFKLQRRAHFRIKLDIAQERSVTIIGRNGKKVFVDAECLDVGAGGACIKLQEGLLPLKASDEIMVVLRINGKRFETRAEVRHVKTKNGESLAGVQFSEEDKNLMNRMQMLVLEFQRLITSKL